MSIKDKLELIQDYFNRNARAGHTTAVMKGAVETNATVVSATHELGRIFKERYPGVSTVGMHQLEKLDGYEGSPLVFDNYTICCLFEEVLEEFSKRDMRNEELMQRIRKIESLSRHIQRTAQGIS